ncbi:acetylornithine aminotransferase [Tulasnella sp. UAMH 9824]|nr:acetylornithine aminotransferase [Tulasnella sp. UAMH 9824]
MASTLRTSNTQLLARRRLLNTGLRYSSTKTPCTTYLKPTHVASADAASALPATATQNIIDTYARPPFIISHGKGSWLWTTNGQKYLDFSSGIAVNALGHADEEFANAMNEQVRKISHTSNVFHNEWAGQLATLIVETTKKEGGLGWAPGSTSDASKTAKVFFSSSGTEANEGAFKFARKIAKEKYLAKNPSGTYADCTQTKFVCFANAFHGRSMGALSATTNPKYQKPFEPLIPGFSVGELNDYEGVSKMIDSDTCAVIVEPVQGEGGLSVCEADWLRLLRKRCDEVGAVLIFDEIQCGLYRTGTLWAHSSLPVDCHPDIVTMAKPLANGYPIGAILVRAELAPYITVGSHGTTFGGSPLATRLGHHVLSRLSSPAFVSHMRDVSSHLASRLQALPSLFPTLLQPNVRGKGLLTGLGFQNPDHPGKLVQLARERGVLVLTAGKDAVRIVPSLNTGKEEVDLAVDVIESCLVVLKEEATQ